MKQSVLIRLCLCLTLCTVMAQQAYAVEIDKPDVAVTPNSETLQWGNSQVSADMSIPEYTITIESSENGSILVDKSKAHASDEVVITSNPAEGYELEKVFLNGVDKGLIDKFNMPAQNSKLLGQFKNGFLLSQCTLVQRFRLERPGNSLFWAEWDTKSENCVVLLQEKQASDLLQLPHFQFTCEYRAVTDLGDSEPVWLKVGVFSAIDNTRPPAVEEMSGGVNLITDGNWHTVTLDITDKSTKGGGSCNYRFGILPLFNIHAMSGMGNSAVLQKYGTDLHKATIETRNYRLTY